MLLLWQALAVVAFAAAGGAWAGGDGALSGALGAAINLVANITYALMGGIFRPSTVSEALFVLLRAEGFKIGLTLVLLILVLKLYRDLAAGPFILAFVVTTLMFGIALRARN